MSVTPEDWGAYYSALGEFLHEFSRMENSMNAYLAQVLADSIEIDSLRASLILRAAVGGQRLAPLRDTLKRLLRVTRAPAGTLAYVEVILKHVGDIHYLRDRLMHNGATL